MSYGNDSDLTPEKSGKSVKRVRFSDEVESVPHFSEYGDDSSSSQKPESETVTPHTKGYESETDGKPFSVDHETIHDEIQSNSGINSPLECDEGMTNDIRVNKNRFENETFPTQVTDNSLKVVNTCSLSECWASGISVPQEIESNELDDLINETRLMSISSAEPTTSSNLFPQAEDLHGVSSSPNSEESLLGDIVKKNAVSTLSRKRSLEGMFIEKQTTKLNSCLQKNSTDINSARELKTNVYNAWYRVKIESAPLQKNVNAPDLTPKNEASEKPNSNKVYDSWKRSKKKTRKVNHKCSEPVFPKQKSKEDIEEGKMAFRAWKKKKDEILRHQKAEKYRQEEKERLDSLMNERIRKKDAESAFSAWNAHKSVAIKLEEKKSQWYLQKEKEKLEVKKKKSLEATEVYYEWLRRKAYAPNPNTFKLIDDRPPWTPPGKTSTII